MMFTYNVTLYLIVHFNNPPSMIHTKKCKINAHFKFLFSKQSSVQPKMSRQVGSPKRSLCYPSNLPRKDSLITSSTLPSFSTNSPHMGSDYSTQTVYNTNSDFNKSTVDTPDEFLDSKSSPPILPNIFSAYNNPSPCLKFYLRILAH